MSVPVLRTLNLTIVLLLSIGASARADGPIVLGSSTMGLAYDTATGSESFQGLRDHTGIGLGDITNLGGAPNVGAFSAHNKLGRRPASAQGANETLMRHGWYKMGPSNVLNFGEEFFPASTTPSTVSAIDVNGNVTLSVQNVQFDRPVSVIENTFLLHVLWDINQVDGLGVGRGYASPHNHHIPTGFRDFNDFFGPLRPFLNDPVPNYATLSAGLAPVFTFNAPDSLNVSFTFPYAMLRHFQDDGMGVPAGLPGPGGFLEPFHFHMEYLVVPEPHAGLLLLTGGWLVRRRGGARR